MVVSDGGKSRAEAWVAREGGRKQAQHQGRRRGGAGPEAGSSDCLGRGATATWMQAGQHPKSSGVQETSEPELCRAV